MTYGTKKVVLLHPQNTAVVAQLVRVPDCGSVGRRFESDLPPKRLKNSDLQAQIAVFFVPIGTESGQLEPQTMTQVADFFVFLPKKRFHNETCDNI